MTRRTTRSALLARTALGVSLALVAAAPAFAQSTNAGNVSSVSTGGAGSTTFSGATSNTGGADTSTITLGNGRTILNWDSFALTSGDTLNFVFGSDSDIVLNRVNAGAAAIDGVLNGSIGAVGGATGGNVWFTSADGVVFGANARVNVGGLLATTANIGNSDFLDGDMNFAFTDATSSPVQVNSGAQLKAWGGTLALIAQQVSTSAGATVGGGGTAADIADTQVLYGAATNFNVTLAPEVDNDLSLVSFSVPSATGGSLSTAPLALAGATTAGDVYLAAVSRTGVVGATINAGGAISATSAVAGQNGSITLAAGTSSGILNLASDGAQVSATTTSLNAANDATIAGNGGLGTLGTITTGRDLTVSANGFIAGVTALNVGRHYAVTATDVGGGVWSPNFVGAVPHNFTITDTQFGLAVGGITVSGDLTINTLNGGSIDVLGALSSTGGNVTLASTATGNNSIKLSANVSTAAGGALSLSSSGNVSQTAGSISAGTLQINATGSASLIQAGNNVGTLAASTFRGLSLFDTGGLTVSGPLTATNGGINLTTTGALVVNAPTITSSGLSADITLSGTSTALNGAAITSPGAVSVNVGTAGPISLNGTSVTTTGSGTQTYSGAVTLGSNTTLTSGGGTIRFNGGSPGFAGINGAYDLVVNNSGLTTFGAGAGDTTALRSLSVNGGTTELAGLVRTTGAQSYGAGTLGASATLTSTGGGAITFGGSISTGGAYGLTINTTGATTLAGFDSIASFVTDAGGTTVLNAGTYYALGAQTYGDAVVLAGNANITGNGGTTTFNSTIDGGYNLTLNGAVNRVFNGAIGGTTALASLGATGTNTFNGGLIRTTGKQTYFGSLTLGANTTLAGSDLDMTFGGSIAGGGRDLTIDMSGASTYQLNGGSLTGIRNLSIGGGGTTRLTGAVTTSGTQTYGDGLILVGATSLTSTGNGAITLGAVDGAFGLGVNTTGATTFGGAVGATTALTSLTTNAGGSTVISGGSIRTSGDQTYGDGIVLGAHAALTGANLSYASVSGSGRDLTLDFTGLTTINGANTLGLRNLTTGGGGTTTLSGAITTSGTQTYNDAVNLGGATTLTSSGGGDIRFASSVYGGHDGFFGYNLGISTAGTTTFGGAVSQIDLLSTDAGGTTVLNGSSISTIGQQSYGDAVVLGANTSLTTSNFVSFNNGLNSAVDGAYGLTVNGSMNTLFAGGVGGTGALSQLTVNGTSSMSGAIRTVGDQTYTGTVTLNGNATLTGEDLQLAGVTGAGNDLALNFSGATALSGTVSGVRNLSTGGGGTTTLAGTIATTGTQIYDDAVTLTGNAVLTSSGAGAAGNITLNGTVNGAQSLTVNTAGATTFGGAVGATTALTSLTTNAGGTTALNGGSVRTTGAQTFGDAVTLGADTTLTSAGAGAIGFSGTVNGARNLTVDTAGATTFGAAVGDTTALASLSTVGGGATTLSGDRVTTSGDQTYENMVLGTHNTLASTGGGDIRFAGTVTASAGHLGMSVRTTGATSFAGAVGQIGHLITDAGGTTTFEGGSVLTTGIQTYGDSVVLAGDTTFTSATGGAIEFAGAVDGAHGLTVNTSNTTTFSGAVGATTALASLTTNAGGATQVLGSVRTSGGQSYGDSVTAAAGAAFTAGGALQFASLTGSGDLTLSSGGTLGVSGPLNVYGGYTVTAADFTGAALAPLMFGAGAISITDTAGGLNLGALTTSGDLNVTVLNGGLTVGGALAGRDVTLRATGPGSYVTLDAGVSGRLVALAAGAFINNAGASALTASDHWAVYTAAPEGNVYGGLDSGHTALWGAGYGTLAPADTGGNRYVFGITPVVTFISTGGTKTYGDNGAGVMGYTVSGLHGGVAGAFQGDTLASAFSGSASLSSAGAAERASVAGGPYLVTIGAGDLASLTGYAIALSSQGQIVVTPRAITAAVTANDKTYDGTNAATGSVQSLAGVLAGDVVGVSGGTFSFADENAGADKVVTVSGLTLTGADAGNYTVTVPATVLADIFKLAITGTVTADDKTYDGSAAGTGSVSLNGVLVGDTVGTSGATFTFANPNAGADKVVTVSGVSLTGADAGNYTLSLPATVLADILRKQLTGVVVANDKTYDGSNAGTGSVTLNGVVLGDAVGTSGTTFTFADKNAGADKVVTVAGTALTGADAGNYTLTVPATVLADILRKELTGTVIADDKTYDGTLAGSGAVILNGVVDGDTVNGGATFTFADKNAGAGKTVNVSAATLTGADAGNYTLALPATVLAEIFKKALTGTVIADDKTYDGTLAGSGTVILNGVVDGDAVNGGATFTFADKNAGAGKTVNITAAALTGADAGNYTVTLPASVLAEIYRKALTGTVIADDKTYDGSTAGSGTVILNGVVDGDTVNGGATFTFADVHAGAGKTVTISGGTLTGADAGNYTVTLPASVLADILRRQITVAATNAAKPRGDADPALAWTLASGSLVAGDSLTGSLTRAPGEAVGTYAIGQGSLAASADYQVSFTPGTFEITAPAADPGVPAAQAYLQAIRIRPDYKAAGQGELAVSFEDDAAAGEGGDNGCDTAVGGCPGK